MTGIYDIKNIFTHMRIHGRYIADALGRNPAMKRKLELSEEEREALKVRDYYICKQYNANPKISNVHMGELYAINLRYLIDVINL